MGSESLRITRVWSSVWKQGSVLCESLDSKNDYQLGHFFLCDFRLQRPSSFFVYVFKARVRVK